MTDATTAHAAIDALQATITTLQAQLAALQALYDADEAILHPPPPPPPPATTGPMMGMVPGGWWWHPAGTPDDGSYAASKVTDFERLMGRGVQVINQSLQNQTPTWNAYQDQSINQVIKGAGAVIGLPPRRAALRFQLGITGQSAAANFAEIATGARDAGYTAIFQAMKDRGFDRPFLGVGQESNGEWWPATCSIGNEAAFKAAFRRVAGLAKAVMPDCVICYDVSNTRPIAGAAYPGADVVDAIILDYYDRGGGIGDSHGLAEMLALAKPFLICEWATQDSLRGAAFIDWFWQQVTGSPLFIGQCYWRADEWSFSSNPLSKAAYIAKFGGQAPPIYVPPPPQAGVSLTKWTNGGSAAAAIIELVIGGVSQGNQTMVANTAFWPYTGNIPGGTVLSFKVIGGSWWVFGSATVTAGDLTTRTKTWSSGQTVSNGQSASWAVS